MDATSLVLTRPSKRGGEMKFVLDPATRREGTVEVGSSVSVRYHEDGKTNVATAITAEHPKQQAAHKGTDALIERFTSGTRRTWAQLRPSSARPHRVVFCFTHAIASIRHRSNSGWLSLKRWSDALTIQSFFGSPAPWMMRCTSESGTNSSSDE